MYNRHCDEKEKPLTVLILPEFLHPQIRETRCELVCVSKYDLKLSRGYDLSVDTESLHIELEKHDFENGYRESTENTLSFKTRYLSKDEQ